MAYLIHLSDADRDYLQHVPMSETAKGKVTDFIAYGIANVDDAFRKAGKRVEDAGQRIGRSLKDKKVSEEAEKLISYLNDEVVPAIRKGSSQALRVASKRMNDLAEFLERNRP